MGEWLGAESQRADIDELIAAEYGGAAWIDEVAAGELLTAYVRRKRFEARLIAAEVGRLFGGRERQQQERISSDELLRMMGVE